jgi:ATP-dependent Clp protease ATP-binding subunit ClpC
MKRVAVHPSVRLVWYISDEEACRVGAQMIEPSHFLLAALMIIDDNFDQAAELIGLSPEEIKAVQAMADECRAMLGMTDDEITTARRSLRQSLGGQGAPLPLQNLPRSTESGYLHQKAARLMIRMGQEELTLAHLLDVLLDNLPPEAAPFMKVGGRPKPELPPLPTTRRIAFFEDLGLVNMAPAPAAQPSPAGAPLMIEEIGRDLTALARKGQLAPVVGRETEMTSIARYLQRTSKRNVLIIGEAGIGKTAVVEGLAQRLESENAPEFLRSLRVVQISLADLVSGAKYRGDLEQRVQQIIAEATADPHLVLFFDEIHLMMKSGAGGDATMDIANLFKPALAREDFRCIGATTIEEFERYIKNDAAFMRRFQVLRLSEPSIAESVEICRAWARRLEAIQQVVIEDEAIEAAVTLSAKLIRGRSLPDKAIDLLENAATYIKITSLSLNQPHHPAVAPRIRREHIESVIEEQYGFPVSAEGTLDAGKAEALLRKEIIGQDAAIAELSQSLLALRRLPEGAPRPFGVFMFIGSTGIGKTYAAECLSRALFGDGGQTLGRFNMSEFKERHELARLIGAPPGYIGHEKEGALFRFISANPQGVILLDEMEKAHSEIQDYFLQIFDQGVACDAKGRQADFRHYLFVMTCNIAGVSSARREIGFRALEQPPSQNRETPEMRLERHFRPEFLARIDRIIEFRPLALNDYRLLADRYAKALIEKVAQDHEVDLMITEEALSFLAESFDSQDEGVRGCARLFERLLSTPFFKHFNADPAPGVVLVSLDDNHLSFSRNGGA